MQTEEPPRPTRHILSSKLLSMNVVALLIALTAGTAWQITSANRASKERALNELKEFVEAIDPNIVGAAWQINRDTMAVLMQSITTQSGVAEARYQDSSMDVVVDNKAGLTTPTSVCTETLRYDYSRQTVQNQALGSGTLTVCFDEGKVHVTSMSSILARQLPLVFMVLFVSVLLSVAFYRIVIMPLQNLSSHLRSGEPMAAFVRHKQLFFSEPDEIDTLVFELKERTNKLLEERKIVDISVPEAQDTIVQTDASFRVLRHNKKLLDIVGKVEEHTRLSDFFERDLSTIIEPEEVCGPNGRHYEIRSVRFHDTEDGGYLFMLRDLTEAQEKQNATVHESKMAAIGVLASGVAHDFNNILGGILGNAEFVLEEEHLSKPGQAMLAAIIAHSERGASLSTQLLSFARQKSQKRQTFLANDAIENLVALAKPILGKNVKIVYHEGAESAVNADRGLLESALMNLVINARDALAGVPNGQIILTLGKQRVEERNFTQIIVTDNGCGIPKSILQRVREPFFTSKKRGEGSGLGMAMVHGFAEQSNGSLEIRSEVGVGTHVILLLPQASIDEIETLPPRVQTLTHNSENAEILIVEDEPTLREIMRLILKKAGYNVTVASSIEQVKQGALHLRAFDLVVCDLILEDSTAPEILDIFRSAGNVSKFVYVSGNFPPDIVDQLGGTATIATLDKPFKNADFLNFVSSQWVC